MLPYLYQSESVWIPSYHVFLVLGALAGGIVGWREARRAGFSSRDILTFYLAVFPGALFAGVINGWLFNPEFYSGLGDGRPVLYGGLVTYGVVFGALLLGYLYARRRGQSVGEVFDLIALILPLVFAFVRVGCLLNGCCFGLETEGFGGVYLPNIYGQWDYRYPTQIMLLLFDLGMFTWLWNRRRDGLNRGHEVLSWLFVFAAGRLMIDSLRDLDPVLGGLGFHQWTAILTLLAVAGLWAWRRFVPPRSLAA